MNSQPEQRLNTIAGTLDTVSGRLPDPQSFRRFALDHLLVAEICTLVDAGARTQAVKAGLARRDAGIDPAELRALERRLKAGYPFDAARFSSDDATRLQAQIRLAAFLRAAVS